MDLQIIDQFNINEIRVCLIVLCFLSLGGVSRIRNEMCNAPGRKPQDESLAMSSLF